MKKFLATVTVLFVFSNIGFSQSLSDIKLVVEAEFNEWFGSLGAYNKTFQSVTVKIDDETIRPTDGVKVMMIKGTLNYYSKYCNKPVETDYSALIEVRNGSPKVFRLYANIYTCGLFGGFSLYSYQNGIEKKE